MDLKLVVIFLFSLLMSCYSQTLNEDCTNDSTSECAESAYRYRCAVIRNPSEDARECLVISSSGCETQLRRLACFKENKSVTSLDFCFGRCQCCECNDVSSSNGLCVVTTAECMAPTALILTNHNCSFNDTNGETFTSLAASSTTNSFIMTSQSQGSSSLITSVPQENSFPMTTQLQGVATDVTTQADDSRLNDLLRILHDGDLQCRGRSECAAEVVNTVVLVEEELKKLSRNLLKKNQTSLENPNLKMETLKVECVNISNCDAHLNLSDLDFYNEDTVSDYYVTAAKFDIHHLFANLLIDDARIATHGDVSYVIVADDDSYLSAAGYDENDSRITNASLDFTWDGHDVNTDLIVSIIRGNSDDIRVKSVVPRCRFIDTVLQRFSEKGCDTIVALNPHSFGPVRCECSHTTVFAILLSVNAQVVPYGVKICSYVTESLSVVFLAATIATLLRYRTRIKSDRTMIQAHLSVSLFFLHLVMLFHDLFRMVDELCAAAAVVTHFFLLSSAMWMAVEGIRLYLRTSDDVLKYGTSNPTRQIVINLAVGWGVPFFFTLVFAAIGWTLGSYIKVSYLHQMGRGGDLPRYDICWIDSSTTIYITSVVVPVSLALAFNFIITCKVLVTLVQMNSYTSKLQPNKTSKKLSNVKAILKALFILFTILGTPWVIGFLTGIESLSGSVVMMYVNVLVNGLQGCFIFVLYCLCNPTLRHQIESSGSHMTIFKNSKTS